MSTTFEAAFSEAEHSAAQAAKAGGAIASAARAMQKAAQEGDVGRLRRTAERLQSVADAARQDIANARAAWPFNEAAEKEYWDEAYEKELLEQAAAEGLQITSRDARLLAYPSIIQLLPHELALRLDRKRVAAIRPTYLVKILLANQTKRQKFQAAQFVEALYNAYVMIARKAGMGSTVLLADVYDAFTLQPGAKREYDRSDFVRDIFVLDRSGLNQARSGARLALTASTGTKGASRNVFTFVAPDGEVVSYYGIQFRQG